MIEIRGLNHRFADGTQGLQDISLTIRAGEFVVIAGCNGSGKTTLFRHLNGLLKPDSGDIRIGGVSVAADILRARQMVGLVFQDADSQIVGETVYADAAFGPENLCLPVDEIARRVATALNQVGLEHLADQPPHRLSGGEKRRLAIAGILAMESPILVLDEPFSNLDYPGILQVQSCIAGLHAQGRTIILSTHDMDKVVGYASRLILMRQGRVIQDGPLEDILPKVEAAGVKMPCKCAMNRK